MDKAIAQMFGLTLCPCCGKAKRPKAYVQVLGEATAAGLVSSPPYADGCAHTGGADKHPEHIEGGKTSVGLGYAQHADSLVSSPPYSGNEKCDYRVPDANGLDRDARRGKRQGQGSFRGSETYGGTEGQLGALPTGVPPCEGMVTSPPFLDILNNHDTPTKMQALHDAMHRDGKGHGGKIGASMGQSYGASPGQLSAMPPGIPPVQGLVTSPPFGTAQQVDNRTKVSSAMSNTWHKRIGTITVGDTTGQLGAASPTTFWEASLTILQQCFAVLAPGAVAVFVVKAYVRDKQIVNFPAQWQRTCEAAGFVLVEWIEASLVTRHGVEQTLWGEDVVRQTSKKSFFRVLAEAKGAPKIDAEIVLIFRRP